MRDRPDVPDRSTPTVGDGAAVRSRSCEGATSGRNVTVGPFARIRPGTMLADNVIVGSYVEVKNATSAPTRRCRTCRTSATRASASARTSVRRTSPRTRTATTSTAPRSATMCAPARIPSWWRRSTIGDGAVTGAGSVISKDVPAGALAVERTNSANVKGYRKRKDARDTAAQGAKAREG